MKISLNWLNDYIDTGKLSVEKIADILSDIGFATESIEQVAGDCVIDIDVSSNRGDCLGHIGIARELAAALGRELKIPAVELDVAQKDVSDLADVQIAEPDICHRYTARVIEDVKVGPTPDWMRKRLEAVGMRSVNNVVDATNYAMMETGQPPHAFDYQKITDSKIIVRKAKAGERITSIDGSKCDLDPDMLVIADAKKPVAIAGVMGGFDTEVSDATTAILLEDAYFDPVTVRTTSRKLALPSESSFRFERIVDVENIDWASKRTAQLITQVAGGKVAKGVVDIYPKKPKPKKVTIRITRLNKLLGIEVPTERAIDILSGLNFEPRQDGDTLTCSIPSWRSDIYREADLIEEVARIYGYDKVPTENKISIKVISPNQRQKISKQIVTYLNGCGFYETINITFVDDSTADLFTAGEAKNHLSVLDVSRKSANLLRQNLLGSLFGVLKTNLNAANTPCRIFEIADTFVPSAKKKQQLPIEKTKITIVSDGQLRQLRGVVEGLIKILNSDLQTDFKPSELTWAKAGAQIVVDGQIVGTAGVVNRAVKDKFDFEDVNPCGAELDLDCLMALKKGPVQVKPIPKYPAIVRDLSLVIEEHIPWAEIADAVSKARPAELEDVRFVGIYRGKGIDAGKKSLTLSLQFRDTDGTLTHEKVDSLEADIVKIITNSTTAKLRTI